MWDAGKTKKGVPGLRQVFAKQKRGVWGTLGDYFFGFAVAGTRNFGPCFFMTEKLISLHSVLYDNIMCTTFAKGCCTYKCNLCVLLQSGMFVTPQLHIAWITLLVVRVTLSWDQQTAHGFRGLIQDNVHDRNGRKGGGKSRKFR